MIQNKKVHLPFQNALIDILVIIMEVFIMLNNYVTYLNLMNQFVCFYLEYFNIILDFDPRNRADVYFHFPIHKLLF